jgi:hypothetical protein
MKFPLGAMTVGDVLDRGLKLLFARLPVFFLINLIVLSPAILLAVVAPMTLADDGVLDVQETAILGLASIFALVVLQPIGTAAILHIIMEEYAGRRPSMGQAFSFAFTRFLPLLGTSIIVGIIVMVGFVLCIAPGIYFLVSYIFVAQVVVLEKMSGGAAMTRSMKLIEGHRGRVFGAVLLIWVATFLVGMGLGYAQTTVLPAHKIVPAGEGVRVEFNAANHVIGTVVTQLVQILFSTYLAVCTTLLYLDLRIRKEGFDLEMAAGLEGTGGPTGDEDDDRPRRRRPDPREKDNDW